MITLEALLTKIASRKFWSLVAALVTSLLILFNLDENTTAQIVAAVGAFGSIIVYIFAEAYVDAKAVAESHMNTNDEDDIV